MTDIVNEEDNESRDKTTYQLSEEFPISKNNYPITEMTEKFSNSLPNKLPPSISNDIQHFHDLNLPSKQSKNEPITLVVGGYMFQLCSNTIKKSSKLQKMVQEGKFIDRDPFLFGWIVHYLRTGEMEYPSRISNSYITVNSLQKEFKYYDLDWPERCFYCYNLFDPERNTSNSCVYHPGIIQVMNISPTLQAQYYDCCNQKPDSVGCKYSSHLNEVLAFKNAIKDKTNLYPNHNINTYTTLPHENHHIISHSNQHHNINNVLNSSPHNNFFNNVSKFGMGTQDDHTMVNLMQNNLPNQFNISYTNIPYPPDHPASFGHNTYNQTYCHSTPFSHTFIPHIYTSNMHDGDINQNHLDKNMSHIKSVARSNTPTYTHLNTYSKISMEDIDVHNDQNSNHNEEIVYDSYPVDNSQILKFYEPSKNGISSILSDMKIDGFHSSNNEIYSANNHNKNIIKNPALFNFKENNQNPQVLNSFNYNNINEKSVDKKIEGVWRIRPEEGKQVPLVCENSVVHKTQAGKMCIHPDGSTVVLPSLNRSKSTVKKNEKELFAKKKTKQNYDKNDDTHGTLIKEEIISEKDSTCSDTKTESTKFLSSISHDSRYKTKMCPLLKIGSCPRSAENCNFAHSFDDLRPTEDFYKTKLCAFYSTGYCKAGTACRHAHGESDVRFKENSLSNMAGQSDLKFVWFETDTRKVQVPISKIPPCYIQQK